MRIGAEWPAPAPNQVEVTLVGTLRHLLTEAPQFCPVTPLPSLRAAACRLSE